MKKYEIVKNGEDDYSLKYKDKEIKFHSTVGMVKRLQEATKKARINMLIELGKQGISIKDLIIEEKRDGKTYYDDSNKIELEKAFIESTTSEIFQAEIEKALGIDIVSLLTDIEITDEEEASKFAEEIGGAILGQTPRQ